MKYARLPTGAVESCSAEWANSHTCTGRSEEASRGGNGSERNRRGRGHAAAMLMQEEELGVVRAKGQRTRNREKLGGMARGTNWDGKAAGNAGRVRD